MDYAPIIVNQNYYMMQQLPRAKTLKWLMSEEHEQNISVVTLVIVNNKELTINIVTVMLQQ